MVNCSPNNSRPNGRPRVLDDVKRSEICALTSVGVSLRKTAGYVDCSVKTIRREAERNAQFGEQLRRAQMKAQLGPLHALHRASDTHWRAAAWFLERIYPDLFGRTQVGSFGKKELRKLGGELLRIVRHEVSHPLELERVEARMEATLQYATRAALDTDRGGGSLKRALELAARKESQQSVFEESAESTECLESLFRSLHDTTSEKLGKKLGPQ
jgi:hypothetical protein